MPVKLPVYLLTRFDRENNSLLARNWKAIEAFPVIAYVNNTANLGLTTTPVLIPGMTVTVPVPANASLEVEGAFDLECPQAAGGAIVELWTAQPVPGTTTFASQKIIGTATPLQALVVVNTTGTARQTVPQHWHVAAPFPGVWTFQARAYGLTSTTAFVRDHCSLRVMAL